MPLALTPTHVVGLCAGALLVGVGLFVLVARPESPLHRLFFALALADGASTAALQLRNASTDAWWRVAFMEWYWASILAFIVLLVAFGALFPRPLGGSATRRWAVPLAAAAYVALLGAYVLAPTLAWRHVPGPLGGTFEYGPLGALVIGVGMFGGAALVLGRLTYFLLRPHPESHRRQAVFVLAGMLVAYVPVASVNAILAYRVVGAGYLTAGAPAHALGRASYLLVVAAALAALLLTRGLPRFDRNVVRAATGAAIALSVATLLLPGALTGALVKAIALLAYPILLCYAILRFEVFDIDARLRRAATVTLVGAMLAAAFVAASSVAESFLEDRLGSLVRAELVAGITAALVTAAVSVPVSRASRLVVQRVAPTLTGHELDARKEEVYYHALCAVVCAAAPDPHDSRALESLRATLRISDATHQRLVQAAQARAVAA
ncbi:MAG TPA: hypothetical protein VFH78_01180 [Candidatus Thermoplasmatota archaeon]|nr:hypothetical protein [Candidatus Thermoplasmatota archaeon]